MHIPLNYNQKCFWLDPIVECRAEDGRELVIEINANGRIGEGGNAVVYRCVDQVTGEDYAIKIQMQRGFKRLKRFCREVKLLSSVQHLQLMHSIANGNVYIESDEKSLRCPFALMPIASSNLYALIKNLSHLLPFEELAGQYRGLSEALAKLHESAIHRDIKPENILVCGSSWVLSDFGLCKFLNDSEGEPELTMEGENVGPKYWMSPEYMNHRIGNGDEITKASDVFQLAAVFWFAATKRHPTGIVKSSDWPGPPKMFEVLESALSHDPLSRPQDGHDFHVRIKSALEN